jgi:hypothetical protein
VPNEMSALSIYSHGQVRFPPLTITPCERVFHSFHFHSGLGLVKETGTFQTKLCFGFVLASWSCFCDSNLVLGGEDLGRKTSRWATLCEVSRLDCPFILHSGLSVSSSNFLHTPVPGQFFGSVLVLHRGYCSKRGRRYPSRV